ncbi:MAG: hypothetical protein LC745_12890, partial [Planctomycetia bacterium]|nr:hypothetical protein [Planctomycetia bacterium]
KTLAQPDRDIFFSLLLCCRQADPGLDDLSSGSPPAARQSPAGRVRTAVVFVTMVAVSVLIFWLIRGFA